MKNSGADAIIRCPSCRKQGPWFSRPTGPFCSSRCKMVDLGKWLGEEHTISEPLQPEHLENVDLPDPGEVADRAGNRDMP
jgi:endogenous inhibitor of DNA gyrase (YacG/DUF329 family)